MQCNKGKRRLPHLARGFAALCAALAVAAAGSASAAPTETVLHSFAGSDGSIPAAALIADSSGNLYGTTFYGGAGCGGVVKLSPGAKVSPGTETVLHSFTSSDGENPEAGLIADRAGNLYGTTVNGGPSGSGCGGSSGNGVVFKLSPIGTETMLHSFTGGTDGANPVDIGSLIADRAGNLYGTTQNGGASNLGTVVKLYPGGIETVLHSFAGGTDGANPFAGLIADSSGNLYGTTTGGGASGGGVVFKLSPGGIETVLYSFTGGRDGAAPFARLS